MSDACVWIDPARRSGEPCVHGTRVNVERVAETVWAHGVDEAQACYDLTRAQVLGACWYAGAYGIVRLHRDSDRGPFGYLQRFRGPWRRRWRTWAESVAHDLWRVASVDYDAIPDPPTR